MFHKRSVKILLFLIIPVVLAGFSFFYNFADILFSPGKLTLGHTKYNKSCFDCHMPLVKVSTSCLACHEDLEKEIDKKTGFHGSMDDEHVESCLACHTDHQGPETFIVKDNRGDEHLGEDLEKIRENHKLLKNEISMEPSENYAGMWEELQSITEWPERLKILEKKFDHRLTGYPLTGEHAKVKCEKCHDNIKKFTPTEKEGMLPNFSMKEVEKKEFCYSCHKKDDEGKKGHKGEYGKDCSSCHIIGGDKTGWKALVPKIRKHHEKPKHKLEGKHRKTKCQKCHLKAPFEKKKEETRCVYCHKKDDEKIHEKSLGKECENCHTPEDFRKPTFDHQKTSFILYHSHQKLKCQECHPQWDDQKEKKKIYKKIENVSCYYCHAADDVHRGSFKTDCERCHRETSWLDLKRQ